MITKRWPLVALAVTATVTLLSACGSSTPPSTDAGTSHISSAYEKAVKFAECIRSNGVTEFPDPTASGSFSYGIKAGSSLDPSSAAWQKAIGVCKSLEPVDFIQTHFTDKQTEARLKFAQCVRANGVPDFPDPTANGPLIDVTNASSIPGLQATIRKCIHLNPEAI